MEKTVFTFGRLNPPTVGHEKLVNKVKQVAKRLNAEPHVYLSHSQNSKKDPLNYNQKFKYAKQAFGSIVTKSNARTVIQIMQELEKMNHKDVVMVVGSDRVQEFRTLLNKYNGKDYTFDSIKVVSAGERDPDAEGVSGMSASKMRAAVEAGDQASFMKGVPSKLSKQSAARMYSDLRSAMNITEDFDDFDWDLWAETVDVDNEEIIDEAVMSYSQRIKRARTMKRLAPRMKNLRRIKKFRMADKDVLQKRARKQAISMFRKKVAGDKGAHYSQLSPAAKISIDKLVQKKLPAVTKLAQRLLPKVRKAEVERLRSARKSTNEQTEEGNKAQLGIPANATNAQLKKIRSSDSSSKEQKQRAHWLLNMRKEEVAQDKDIKDREGTQPKKYFKDLPKSTKAARDAHFKKHADKDDSDPANYKPAPGDKDAKTKPSVHTKKYKQMYGEKVTQSDLKNIEKDADNKLKQYNIDVDLGTRHFADRVNDKRNEPEIKKKEISDLLDKVKDKKGQKIKQRQNGDAVLRDKETQVNIPVAIKTQRDGSGKKVTDVTAKTIMRKRNFKTSKTSPTLAYEGNGQEDDVQDIVPNNIRVSMISSSKKRVLNDKFEQLGEQDSADLTRDRQAAERKRLRDKQKREKEQQQATHDRQLDRSKIRDIRSESLDEAFEAMQPKQQKGRSSISPRDSYLLDEKQIDALKKKAEKSGISYGTLKKVYDRGMAAWKSGHRPGTTPQQWAFARVNSFVTKSKGTWGGADKDLASKVRKESVVTEQGGAGEYGTDKLVKKYKQYTPMQEDDYAPHWMYKGDDKVWAKTKAEHDRLNKKGYDHDDPKTKKVEE